MPNILNNYIRQAKYITRLRDNIHGMSAEIRRVIKLGEATLAITLPKSWVKAVGLKKGDALIVREEDGKLTIEKSGRGEETPSACIIRSETCIDEPEMLTRMIVGAYVNGYDVIYIPMKGRDPDSFMEEIKLAEKKLFGLYVSEHSEHNVILHVIADQSKPTINTSLVKLHIIIGKVINIAYDVLKSGKPVSLMVLDDLYDDFDKTYLLAVRQLLKSQYNKALLKRLGLKSYLWIIGDRAVLSALKMILNSSRDLVDISLKLARSDYKVGEKALKEISELLSWLKKASELSLRSFLAADAKRANRAILDLDALRKHTDKMLNLIATWSSDAKHLVMLACFLRMVKNISYGYKFIAEIAINRATEISDKYVVIDVRGKLGLTPE